MKQFRKDGISKRAIAQATRISRTSVIRLLQEALLKRPAPVPATLRDKPGVVLDSLWIYPCGNDRDNPTGPRGDVSTSSRRRQKVHRHQDRNHLRESGFGGWHPRIVHRVRSGVFRHGQRATLGQFWVIVWIPGAGGESEGLALFVALDIAPE